MVNRIPLTLTLSPKGRGNKSPYEGSGCKGVGFAVRTVILSTVLVVSAYRSTFNSSAFGAEESDYYRIVSVATSQARTESRSKNWKPAPEGLALEISGMTVLDDDRIAVAIRKGEVWILGGVYDEPPRNVTYKKFASALHEPLGLLKRGDAFYSRTANGTHTDAGPHGRRRGR